MSLPTSSVFLQLYRVLVDISSFNWVIKRQLWKQPIIVPAVNSSHVSALCTENNLIFNKNSPQFSWTHNNMTTHSGHSSVQNILYCPLHVVIWVDWTKCIKTILNWHRKWCSHLQSLYDFTRPLIRNYKSAAWPQRVKRICWGCSFEIYEQIGLMVSHKMLKISWPILSRLQCCTDSLRSFLVTKSGDMETTRLYQGKNKGLEWYIDQRNNKNVVVFWRLIF